MERAQTDREYIINQQNLTQHCVTTFDGAEAENAMAAEAGERFIRDYTSACSICGAFHECGVRGGEGYG
jgi:hypothetical protein